MVLLPIYLALALCGGVAFALTAPISPYVAVALLAACAAGAAHGAHCGRLRVVVASALVGASAAGAALGAHADRRARGPELPALLDELRPDGAVVLSGLLEEDASVGANGVRLRLAVQKLAGRTVDGSEAVALTVSGTLAQPQAAHWRAGRAVQTTATLRRPAHYLDPGVADDRLALARRGLDAGRQREERGRWSRSWRRARGGRSAPPISGHTFEPTFAAHVVPRDRHGRGHRDRDSHRRPRRPRSSAREAPADCRHVSRHRDLWRQYRRAHRSSARPGAPVQGSRAAWRPAGGTAAWWLHAGTGRRWRIGGARDDDGGDLFWDCVCSTSRRGASTRWRPLPSASWWLGPWRWWTPDSCSASAPRRPSSCSRRKLGRMGVKFVASRGTWCRGGVAVD